MSSGDTLGLARIEELFHRAVDLSETERQGLFAPLRESEPELVAEVERLLLRADERRDLSAWGVLSPAADAIGSRVGPYRLVEQVGEGGMGYVYRAERADGNYDQTVAVKRIKAGPARPDLAERFLTERQILARLEHPNIARLLDGAMTAEGAPYLVMEYVEGLPITDYCDANRLKVRQRIELFLTVCRAVAHAHRNLVVHRDLKPSNILVTQQGEVKLLDFGIAKLLSPRGVGEPDLTRAQAPVLTPGYASPEQVRGEAITTATDVYALGLLLYELLSGCRAQVPKDQTLEAIERAICEDRQPRPSTALASGTEVEIEARLTARGESRLTRLGKVLRGDLDTITATALRKDPARRYASADRLAEDLERHLSGQPVEARPDSVTYRLGKFLARHRLAAAATAAVVTALVLGLVLALLGLRRARDAEHQALEEAATSSQISEFLVDLFQANDPGEALGETITARDLLDQGAERINDELSDQPTVQARLLGTMALAYASLGLYDSAIELSERRLALEREIHGERSLEAARVLSQLSIRHRQLTDHTSAQELARQAVEILEQAPDVESDSSQRELANALAALGQAYGESGELEPASSYLERALAIRERLGDSESDLWGSLNNLATVRWRQGDTERARDLYRRALQTAESEFGNDHPQVANLSNNLALVHSQAGEIEQAITAHERALAIREKVLEPDHPDLAESLSNLGDTLRNHGELERGRQMLERALVIREKSLGPDHDFVAYTVNNLGLAHLDEGDGAAARPYFERALAHFERKLGPRHYLSSFPISGLGRVAEMNGDYETAERNFLEVIEIRRERLGESHPLFASGWSDYGVFLRNRGRLEEAEAADRRAAEIRGEPGEAEGDEAETG